MCEYTLLDEIERKLDKINEELNIIIENKKDRQYTLKRITEVSKKLNKIINHLEEADD